MHFTWLGYRPLVHLDRVSDSASKLSFTLEELSQHATSENGIPPDVLRIPYQKHEDAISSQVSINKCSPGGEPPSMFFLLRNIISSVLSRRVNDRLSVTQVLIIVAYSAGILVALNFRGQVFSHLSRGGWIAASQVPFVYAFATKNNLVGCLAGFGYEKLNYLHRLVGRCMFIAALLHVFTHISKWSLENTLSERFSLNFVRWGLVAFTALSLQWLLSIRPIRFVVYRFFCATHVIGSAVFLVALSKHAPVSRPYVLAAIVLYGIDHIVRLLKTRVTTANSRVVPELGLTFVEIPTINKGWRAGQHVRLRVPSTGMGLWGALEAHPFTISNVPGTEQGLVIVCKKVGPWTNKLFSIANSSIPGERDLVTGKAVRVVVEGPYGGIGYSDISKHSAVMLIVGGSGVTFALSAILETMQRRENSSVQVIHFVWCVPTPVSISPLITLFRSLAAKNANTNIRLRIRIFYTRAPTILPNWPDMPLEISITPGRPQMKGVVNRCMVDTTRSCSKKNGLFIGVCGPGDLGKNVAEVVRTLDANCKNAVGGVHLHEEIFGF
ncbi:hypothetical protein J3A83DRAFT_1335481 [Scleroderma citrinum]